MRDLGVGYKPALCYFQYIWDVLRLLNITRIQCVLELISHIFKNCNAQLNDPFLKIPFF